MRLLNDNTAWATIIMGILVVVAAAVGGAVVIWGPPGALSFETYLNLLKDFAIAVGILGIGRGIASFGKQSAAATILTDTAAVAGQQQQPAAPQVPAAWTMPVEPDYPADYQPGLPAPVFVPDGETNTQPVPIDG